MPALQATYKLQAWDGIVVVDFLQHVNGLRSHRLMSWVLKGFLLLINALPSAFLE